MDWVEGLKWVGVVFGAGGVFKLLDYVLKRQTGDLDSFKTLRDSYSAEFGRLESKIDRLVANQARLEHDLKIKEAEISILRAQLENMKKAYPDLPIPLWLKDRNGIMLSLNDAYEKAFLIPQGKHRPDYIMQTDSAIWPPNVVEVFKKNDLKAIEKKHGVGITWERPPEMEILKNWEFVKYPYFIDGTLIGIGGIAIPKEKYQM